ncbi:MAG: hypothetical protein C0597_09300, partial [Marinilabiliales bacterium]
SQVKTGIYVITLMKEKYNNSYIQNFTFSQHVVQYKGDSVINKTIWHEAYSSVNQLILKFDTYDSGNGYIFKNDMIYVMKNNKVESEQRDIHDLLVLGFDVYNQPVQVTVDKLTEKAYDMSKAYETELNGKAVYCVGAESDDDNTGNRFYIDKEHLLFVKMINHSHSRYDEAIFDEFKTVKGKYLATKVIFIVDGKPIMTEEYFDMDFPETLDTTIFDPENFEHARW